MVPFLSSTMVHQGSETMSYGRGDMKDRPKTRDTLANNLRALMRATKTTKDDLAKRSGISERMIAYILAKERVATIDVTEALGKPFGLTGWQMMIPNLPVELARSGRLTTLVENYIASDTGREYIDHVAEQEAKYHNKK